MPENHDAECILPVAREKEARTSVGEANGPNVITGNTAADINFTFDSFRKSICKKIDTLTQPPIIITNKPIK